MRKNVVLFLTLFFALPLFFSSVSAQQKTERWVCLKAEKADVHAAKLSVDPQKKLLPTSDTYVFECLTNADCTSGKSALDQQVFQKDSLSAMQAAYGYKFEGTTLASNPIKSDANGEIASFTWQSSTPSSHARRWLALNYVEPTTDLGAGAENTQQVGTFSFTEASNASDCVSLSWDPYGRIFDSSTLDPVSGASVTLLLKRANSSFTPMTPADLLGGNIINPQTTKEDGGFSFVVPDGTYKLAVSLSNYTFPAQMSSLQGNYSQIYSDIYPGQTGEEIVQAGAIQHRDVPLTPKSISQSNGAKLMEYFYDLNKASLTITVKGRVSHPFAQIKAYSLKPDPILGENVRYKLLTETPLKADAKGNFVLKIDQSLFEPDETFGDITVEKVDLTNPGNLVERIKNWFYSLIGQVNAEVTLASNFRFDPIPNYLEGYAYDAQGKVIPNATVSIILDFSNKPSYQTKADEKGYFKVGSEFLPSMPYRVEYTAPSGEVVKTTTSKFIAQNQQTIEKSDINVNQFKDTKGKIISQAPKQSVTPAVGEGNNAMKNLASNSFLPLILAILLTLVLIVIVAVFYFKRKTV